MQGWIKLHRQISENEFYLSERFTKMQAWIDLLLLAGHTKQTIFIRGIEINLKPGELCYSQQSLAVRWKWNFKTVRKFLELLENRQMVKCRINTVTTVIIILNWHKYQVEGEQNGEQKENKTDTNKNVKHVNNEKCITVGSRHALNTAFNTSRNFFISYVKSKINPDYVFDAREGKHLKDILKKISSMRSDMTGDKTEEAFRYIITGITDKWLLDRFTLAKINSQFNEVIQSIKKQNGTDSTFDELAQELYQSGM